MQIALYIKQDCCYNAVDLQAESAFYQAARLISDITALQEKSVRIIIFIFAMLFAVSSAAYSAESENLLGLTLDYDKKEITIHVAVSGCTDKKDFIFEMKDNALTILRTFPDTCKAMQQEGRFTYSLKETGIDPNRPFVVTNKFIANRFVAPFSRIPEKKK